ncbi:hypothetical protein AZZ77_000063, partial [Klebsiella pneumoniae]
SKLSGEQLRSEVFTDCSLLFTFLF